jgi:sugar lactone lactonase YvrE
VESPPKPLMASVALAARDHLGEGPSWNAEERRLSWVDINRGLLRAWWPDDGREDALDLGAPVSFAVAREGGGWAVGRADRIALVNPGGDESTLMRIDDPPADSRFNDAKADVAGRLWAGTMSTVRERGIGSLYRVEQDGVALEVISSTTISNGLGWSPDNSLFYFVDSTTQRLDVFDFDLATGTIEDRRPWVEIDPADGLPDGLAVDLEGGVWICLFGGGRVRRYDSDGRLDAEIRLPVSNPTCPAFGGRDLDRLYLTSAQHRLTPEQLDEQPLAGAILEIDAGVRGIPANRFAG